MIKLHFLTFLEKIIYLWELLLLYKQFPPPLENLKMVRMWPWKKHMQR